MNKNLGSHPGTTNNNLDTNICTDTISIGLDVEPKAADTNTNSDAKGAATDQPKSEKKIIKLEYCNQYSDLIKSMSPEEFIKYLSKNRATEHSVPKDAMSIKDFISLPDEEKCDRLNTMSQQNHKSNLIVMFANGYGFTWTKMRDIALGSGRIITDSLSEGSKKPHFILQEPFGSRDLAHGSLCTEGDKKVLYIERGRRQGTKTIKSTFSEDTLAIINEMFGRLSNLDKSKALEAILLSQLKEIYELYKAGNLIVKYKPVEGESLELGPKQ